MCDDCATDICAVFDAMILAYWRDHPPVRTEDDKHKRPKYMQMDVRNAPKAAAEFETLAELIVRAPGIGFEPWEFKTELAKRTKMGDVIESWANENKIPNGLARKIILSAAEDILLERGAKPQYSFKQAA
jgi:hypothetical protein